jgi:signal transduction histidine kinase
MALETRLPDVYPKHRRKVVAMSCGMTIALVITLATLLLMAGTELATVLLYVVMPLIILQSFTLFVIGKYALEPLDILARTVVQISDQPHDTVPPNLNGTYHEKTGWKMMVDTIYRRGTTVQAKSGSENTAQTSPFDNLPGGVIALNQTRQIAYANKLAPIITDPNGAEHIQLEFDESDSLQTWLNTMERSQVRSERTWSRIQTAPVGTANRRVFDIIANYEKNAPSGMDTVLLLIDRTAHYAVNEESMDFMALAAHELRGPITVIRGYLDILRPELDSVLNEDQKQLFDRLDVSSNRLSGYISNVLNAAKFDRRHLKLHLQEDRLKEIYSIVADDLALRASTQGRMLAVSLPDDLPTIAADRNSLTEVIANLVDNAIKYSREGGQVTVSAAVDGDSVRFRVQDFGIGMPGSVVSGLFNKFYRSHRSKHAVSGTGLGLYISKAIIESHGGRIGVSSVEGEGSTFSFSVPIYSTVAEKLLQANEENQGIIETSSGWIKNHSMYRG